MSYDHHAIDRVLHSPIRFTVMAMLANEEQAELAAIRKAVGATEGNLATHLRKLDDAEYVTVQKSFQGRKPHTEYGITDTGRTAFHAYLAQLNRMVTAESVTQNRNE